MATQSPPDVTPEQYLEFDRNAEFRHEYFFGEIVSMGGGSFNHNLITVNLSGELRNRLLNGPCRVLSSDMRVAANSKSGYVYPDVTVVCGAPEYSDERRDTITNPTLMFEILSPSTRKYDLGEKVRLYSRLSILSSFAFIEQDRISIEHWYRWTDGGWKIAILEDADRILEIPSLKCLIPVKEIYAGFERPVQEEPYL